MNQALTAIPRTGSDLIFGPFGPTTTSHAYLTGKTEGGTTIYSEWRSKQIFRVLHLPAEIDPDTLNATVSDGLLEIELLKVGLSKKVPLVKAATV